MCLGCCEVTIKLDPDIYRIIERRAREEGTSVDKLLEDLVRKFVRSCTWEEFRQMIVASVYDILEDLDEDVFELMVRTGRHLLILQFLDRFLKGARGILAECIAMKFLENQGFRIVNHHGDVSYDFIAEKDGITYFVEVKTVVRCDALRVKINEFASMLIRRGIEWIKRFERGKIRYLLVIVRNNTSLMVDLSEAAKVIIGKTSNQRREVEVVKRRFEEKMAEICSKITNSLSW